jgi:peptide/nickel transport system ATP-binding protein
MYVGKIVELAKHRDFQCAPPSLYGSTDFVRTSARSSITDAECYLKGEVASPANPPSGCYFHPRCDYATDICRAEMPELTEISSGHFVRCHRAEELTLAGIG